MAIQEQKRSRFLNDVVKGLSSTQKTLPCKYFYDETGSSLFEEICNLDEYYITRTELQLIEDIKAELADLIGENAVIVEPGAGAGIKIQTLLSALSAPAMYVPIDISSDFLFYSAQKIQDNFPSLEVLPIQGDFTQPIHGLNEAELSSRVVFFPGSTIGNFTPEKAKEFLSNQAQLIGKNGAIIIGYDLVKSSDKLEAAYNDKQGITADFNKNLLTRINTELGANFNLNHFEHNALFDPQQSRIEMHLISKIDQLVSINQQGFKFNKNETIHTENSYKYTQKDFVKLANTAGLTSLRSWRDNDKLIAIHYLTLNE